MDVVDARELGEDVGELLVDRLLRVLDLLHVELADARDVVALVHDGRRLALRLGEDDVDEVLAGRDDGDPLEVVDGGGHFVCWVWVKGV